MPDDEEAENFGTTYEWTGSFERDGNLLKVCGCAEFCRSCFSFQFFKRILRFVLFWAVPTLIFFLACECEI